MSVYSYLLDIISKKGAGYLVLIDPDKTDERKFDEFVIHCEKSGVDGFLIGGSLMMSGNLSSDIEAIKRNSDLPVIIFPGGIDQIRPEADALLYISLISGRNAEHLFGKHVLAAPLIARTGIEPISTGYILIESGKTTTAEYMSGSKPIPRNKPEIAGATALAAQYLGMKFIYLEAGSGAENSVPDEMVKMVSSMVEVPVIVGGGIRDSITARNKVENGAKIIITGNYFEDEKNWDRISEFAEAIHHKSPITV
jgi:putative glycerol-1-phosphate prenyltransferase